MAIYSRGQIDLALSHCLHHLKDRCSERTIKTRIKRLLETDMKEALEKETNCAFVTENSGQQGIDRVFSGHDCFIIGLALELLDAGFKQSEVVFLCQHTRSILINVYNKISLYPNAHRMNVCIKDYPDIPPRNDDPSLADLRVFFIFEKMDKPRNEINPIIADACICYGLDSLTQELDRRSYDSLKLTVVEVARMALALKHLLKEAPEKKRGRPKKEQS